MYKLLIVTPERRIYESEVTSLTAHGANGYLEVLTHHAPLLTILLPGQLIVRDAEGNRLIFEASGGLLEVANNGVTVLADTASLVN